jgi:methylenetetrahydrofolate dehydrogenase (NADP+)/methenyltetrahydrofolate cyclohydrolase
MRACSEVGLASRLYRFPADVEEEALIGLVETLNDDRATHGILVQLPLPPGVDTVRVLHAILREKDVDGFHLYNAGGLISGRTVFPPCAPFGVMRLLDWFRIPLAGRHAVVVGMGLAVGKPMALMLMQREATVTACNVLTPDLEAVCRLADVLVVAAGVPGLIGAAAVRPGAVVVDVGIHRDADGRITGDVDFPAVSEIAGWITPVPGGVGPMTVTMLLHNTVAAAAMLASGVGHEEDLRSPLAAGEI